MLLLDSCLIFRLYRSCCLHFLFNFVKFVLIIYFVKIMVYKAVLIKQFAIFHHMKLWTMNHTVYLQYDSSVLGFKQIQLYTVGFQMLVTFLKSSLGKMSLAILFTEPKYKVRRQTFYLKTSKNVTSIWKHGIFRA